MRILADSVYARYQEGLKQDFEFPEDGYKGEYIYDIAKELIMIKYIRIKKITLLSKIYLI